MLTSFKVIERLYQQIKLKKTNPEIVSGSDSEKVKPLSKKQDMQVIDLIKYFHKNANLIYSCDH